MKVVTAKQMREIDDVAREKFGISTLILMENAGLNVVTRMEKEYGSFTGKTINVLCGPGNNGGDGLVVARHLINQGASVNVFLLFEEAREHTDFPAAIAENLNIIRKITNRVYRIKDEKDLELYEGQMISAHFIVDAIFGTGFKGEARKPYGAIIDMINHAMIPIIAVDIPSGLSGDTGIASAHTIIADLTITFTLPKLGHIIVDGPKYVGKLVVADISIPSDIIPKMDIKTQLIDMNDVKFDIPIRLLDVHKGQVGRVMVVAGSRGLTGAASMTAEAALRAGAGTVTLFCPGAVNSILEQKLTEVMTFSVNDDGKGYFIEKNAEQILLESNKYDVVIIGNGIGRADETRNFLHKFLNGLNRPVVIDADALNLLVSATDILKGKSVPIVITPHLMEMSRLNGTPIDEIRRKPVVFALAFTAEYGVTTVLKSYRTVISDVSGEVYINTTGNPGMATAGMGDVLAGFIGSFFAQGLSAVTSARTAVYLLGYISDYISFSLFENSIIASDIITFFPKAVKDLLKK